MPNTAIKAAITITVLLAAVAAAAGIIMSRPNPEQLTVSESSSAIRAMTVVKESIRLRIRSEGTVTPKTQTDLIPEIKGRVIWISPNLVVGGYFQKGDLLVSIDPADYQARSGLAQAQLLRAEAELEHKSFEHKRLQTLIQDNLVSQSNLENAARAHKIAKANVLESKINLAQAERDLNRTKIAAPFKAWSDLKGSISASSFNKARPSLQFTPAMLLKSASQSSTHSWLTWTPQACKEVSSIRKQHP